MWNDEPYKRQDMGEKLDDLVAALQWPAMVPALTPEARALYDAGSMLTASTTYTEQEMIGFLLILEAMIACPEAVQAALRALRDGIVANEPALALVSPLG